LLVFLLFSNPTLSIFQKMTTCKFDDFDTIRLAGFLTPVCQAAPATFYACAHREDHPLAAHRWMEKYKWGQSSRNAKKRPEAGQ
jgi:hypothetical protein